MTKLMMALVLVVGCGGSKPAAQKPEPAPEPVAAKPPVPTCASVSEKVHAIAAADATENDAKELGVLREVIATRCEADKWSDELRECLGTAENDVDGKGCMKLMTEAQMKAVDADIQAKVGTKVEAAPAVPSSSAPKAAEPAKAAAPAKPERRSRGATPKKAPGREADPCAGGE